MPAASAPEQASLPPKTANGLGFALGDLRTAVSQLQTPGVSALAALDASALDALKDIFYTTNYEDPLNSMPARHFVLEQGAVEAILSLVAAVHTDPAVASHPKRWSVPLYQSVRLLSVLSMPISAENFVSPGKLDAQLFRLRREVSCSAAVDAFVALLQYYIERKAEKNAAMQSAEDSRLEDERINVILRLFRNLLSPPRGGVSEDVTMKEGGVHLAMVGGLVKADLFSTLAVLFASKQDAEAQYQEVVFLVADIYALAYRNTTPREMYRAYRAGSALGKGKDEPVQLPAEQTEQPKQTSVFDKAPPKKSAKPTTKKSNTAAGRASLIRSALLRERAFVGGSRAITSAARWTSRHSGGVVAAIQKPRKNGERPGQTSLGTSPEGVRKVAIKRVVSTRNAIQSKLSLNPSKGFKDKLQVNSDILCLITAKKRTVVLKHKNPRSLLAGMMRQDLQDEGLRGLVALTNEMVDMSFEHFVKALRGKIEDIKSRSLGDDADTLMRAQKAFVCIIGSVVGFQREKYGKVYKKDFDEERSMAAQVHENCMHSVLASDFKIAKEWKPVEAGIELESFQLVFRTLVDGFESVKNNVKEEKKVDLIEHATFAILEMLKLLQSMVASGNDGPDDPKKDANMATESGEDPSSLTPRELALNTLEQLFEEGDFLNAPAELARDFSTKLYSYRHLANVVEVTYAFTRILLTEDELVKISVAKKKSKRNLKKSKDKEGEKEEEANVDKETSEHSGNKSDKEVGKNTEDGNDSGIAKDNSIEEPSTTEGTVVKPLKDIPQDGPDEKPKAGTTISPTDAEARKTDGVVTGEDANATEQKQGHDIVLSSSNLEGKEDKGGRTSEDSSSDQGSDGEEIPEMREVESVGIIRRFATPRAVQTIMLPLRAALCQSSSLSGAVYNVPDGAKPFLTPVVVAKSAHVLAAIWKVAKSREKGALCGSYFTYGSMHFLSNVLDASKKAKVLERSVLERLAIFAADVTREFFKWLKQGPSLALDMFFPMEKGSCQAYATTIYRKALQESEMLADTSDSELDDMGLNSRRGNIDFEVVERRMSERKAAIDKSSQAEREKMAAIRRAQRGTIQEDEDVDDIDKLDIGGGLETSDSENSDAPVKEKPEETNEPAMKQRQGGESPKTFCRLAKKKRRGRMFDDPFESDDEDAVIIRKKRAGKTKATKKAKDKKKAKEQKKVGASKDAQSGSQKVFDSSDEYHEGDLFSDSSDGGSGADDRNGAAQAQVEEKLNRFKKPLENGKSDARTLQFSDSSDDELLSEMHKKRSLSNGEHQMESREVPNTPNTTPGLSKRKRVAGLSNTEPPLAPEKGSKSTVMESPIQKVPTKNGLSGSVPADKAKPVDRSVVEKKSVKRRKLIISDDESE